MLLTFAQYYSAVDNCCVVTSTRSSCLHSQRAFTRCLVGLLSLPALMRYFKSCLSITADVSLISVVVVLWYLLILMSEPFCREFRLVNLVIILKLLTSLTT